MGSGCCSDSSAPPRARSGQIRRPPFPTFPLKGGRGRSASNPVPAPLEGAGQGRGNRESECAGQTITVKKVVGGQVVRSATAVAVVQADPVVLAMADTR